MAALRSRGRFGVAGPCEATGCPAACRPGAWSMPPGLSAGNCSVCCRTLGPSHLPGIAPCSRLVEVRGGVHRTLVAERSASRKPRPETRAESIAATRRYRHFLGTGHIWPRMQKPPDTPLHRGRPVQLANARPFSGPPPADSWRTPKGGASGTSARPRKCSQARD